MFRVVKILSVINSLRHFLCLYVQVSYTKSATMRAGIVFTSPAFNMFNHSTQYCAVVGAPALFPSTNTEHLIHGTLDLYQELKLLCIKDCFDSVALYFLVVECYFVFVAGDLLCQIGRCLFSTFTDFA